MRALSYPETGEAWPFPKGFLWGAATSAYQIEGAVAEEGRRPSIWDVYSRLPGRIRGGDTGDVAADHFHRMAEDVAMMRDLGLTAYRFSVAWPRVRPDGFGPTNRAGLDFYKRLADALLDAGIAPFLTLYHWDLPQALQDIGGWTNRDVAHCFAEYAEEVFRALGDRVPYWTTINEPWCVAFVGYGEGRHAPGVRDPEAAVRAAHHVLLAHGQAVQAMRALEPRDRTLGIVLNPAPVSAASDSEEDRDAARRLDGALNRFFLGAILNGAYPEDVLHDFAESVDLGHIREGDEAIIAAPIDVLGINYYRRFVVRAADRVSNDERPDRERHEPVGWPGGDRVAFVEQDRPRTDLGWEVDPDGLTELLLDLHRAYRPIPIYVTENGAAYDDRIGPDGAIHDLDRIAYLQRHVLACLRAIAGGVDLRGYFVWSLLDNFEWSEGYASRFGLIYVDYESQQRVPKDSAGWYRTVIAANGAPPAADAAVPAESGRADPWR